jgi:hypothetical protein
MLTSEYPLSTTVVSTYHLLAVVGVVTEWKVALASYHPNAPEPLNAAPYNAGVPPLVTPPQATSALDV